MKVETLVCDMCPPHRKAEGTSTFALGGQEYETELCARHTRDLTRVADAYIQHARRVRGGVARPVRRSSRSATVREWAQKAGITVRDRGRVPEAVYKAYDERNGK